MSGWKKRISLILGAFAGGMILVAALYASIALFTFDLQNYPQEPPFDQMSATLVAYLRAESETLPPIFTDRESLHMADVLGLYQGGRRVAAVFAVLSILFCASGSCLGGLRRVASGLQIGMAAFSALAGFVGVWALVDFYGWFTAMHELAFTNDLWLLDPNTSLLIQMLPLSFFINAVRLIALRFLAAAALLLCLSIGIKRYTMKKGPTL